MPAAVVWLLFVHGSLALAGGRFGDIVVVSIFFPLIEGVKKGEGSLLTYVVPFICRDCPMNDDAKEEHSRQKTKEKTTQAIVSAAVIVPHYKRRVVIFRAANEKKQF